MSAIIAPIAPSMKRQAFGLASQGESAAPLNAINPNQSTDALLAPAKKPTVLDCCAPIAGISSKVSRYTWGFSSVTAKVVRITARELETVLVLASIEFRPLATRENARTDSQPRNTTPSQRRISNASGTAKSAALTPNMPAVNNRISAPMQIPALVQ